MADLYEQRKDGTYVYIPETDRWIKYNDNEPTTKSSSKSTPGPWSYEGIEYDIKSAIGVPDKNWKNLYNRIYGTNMSKYERETLLRLLEEAIYKYQQNEEKNEKQFQFKQKQQEQQQRHGLDTKYYEIWQRQSALWKLRNYKLNPKNIDFSGENIKEIEDKLFLLKLRGK